ncbi:hypothetical protein ACH4RA_34560 [Streptomyces smyrnaeus]|nr:hypothetical protein [Streptomyces sp. RK75]
MANQGGIWTDAGGHEPRPAGPQPAPQPEEPGPEEESGSGGDS